MNKKIIFLILLLTLFEFSHLGYDETVYNSINKIYTSNQLKSEVYFNIISNSGRYYEVTNLDGTVIIKNGNKILGKLPLGENAFSFMHDGSSNYNITFTFPNPFKVCGIIISSQNYNYTNILESSKTFYILRKREMEFTILNNNKLIPQIICVSVSLSYSYRVDVQRAFFKEKNKEFVPYYIKSQYYMDFYAILTDELIFNTVIYNPNPEKDITYYIKCSVDLKNNQAINITENKAICLNSNVKFFKIDNNKFNYFEISLLKNTQLFWYDNNYKKTKINLSISEYKNKNSEFLVLNATQNKGCFSIIFSDEENTITNNTQIILSLFNSRSYKITITNAIYNNHRIIFELNSYYNLTNIILPSKVEIISITTEKYDNLVYEFKSKLKTFQIILQFDKIEDYIDDYYKVKFIYQNIKEKEKEYKGLILIDILLIFVCSFITFGFLIFYCTGKEIDRNKLESKGFIEIGEKIEMIYCCKKYKNKNN